MADNVWVVKRINEPVSPITAPLELIAEPVMDLNFACLPKKSAAPLTFLSIIKAPVTNVWSAFIFKFKLSASSASAFEL